MKSSIIVGKLNSDSDDIYDYESSVNRNYSSGQCTDSMDSDCKKQLKWKMVNIKIQYYTVYELPKYIDIRSR